MKKSILIFTIAIIGVSLLLSQQVNAQINMKIRKTDNSIISIPITEIDSVYYEALQNCGTVTDYDGNIYQTITIGTQCWMAENLKVIHYPNGDAIPYVPSNYDWVNLGDNNTDDAFCFYNNTPGLGYGILYTYAASINACPTGWHLPTDAEWTELSDYLGGTSIAGGKMKETGTTHWNSPNTGADNSSGFTALPGGHRYYYDGTFGNMGNLGYWWSSTENGSTYAYIRHLFYNDAEAYRAYNNKSNGLSVRCIRD